MALSSRGQDSGTAADMVPDAGSAPRTLWDFLFATAFVPAVAWDRVTDESSLQDDLVRVAREDLSFEQEEIDGTFESAVAAYVPYRSLATTMANRLHNYIDVWSRSEEKPGSKKCLKCLLDDWSTIRDGFMSALSSQSLEPPSKCLVLGLFASDVVYHVLSKLIGDEEHEGREPIWKMLSGALINVVLPVDLLSQAGRRLLRTIKRQAVKDLEQSGWSPVGLRWYDFDMAICEGYGDDDALVESPNDNRFLKIGLLWYQVTLFSPAGDLIPQLLLPSSKDDDGILANLVWHLHFSTAHSCPAIVLGLVRNYCVWQKQRRFVQDLLRSCDYCQRVARDRIRDYCGVRQIHTIPWYRVGLDVYGPVYRAARYDKQGRAPYNYVLSYTCYYTNKTILRPLHHCSGSEIAMVHKQVVADFGRMPFLS
ncbi:hypothetical protein FOZ63_007101, partial [Perkinsus olseni]